MTVTHIVPALFSETDGVVGGAERYAYELARHMSTVTPTSLVTFGNADREEQSGDFRLRVIGQPWHVRGQRSNPFAFAVLDEVRRAEVVHCHQQHIVASTAAAMACRVTGTKVFCTDLGGGGWDVSAYVSTDRLFNGHLHISSYSRHVAGHDSLDSAHVVFGGVDTAKFSPAASVQRGNRVLYVGRILPHKGIDQLIRALPSHLGLDIAGQVRDGRYVSDLQRLAEGRDVVFHHAMNDGSLVHAYRSALCIVLPSVYDDMYGAHTDVPELLGQTLLEGMACGAPAVGTRVASIPEIIEDGVSGYLVEQHDIDGLTRALTTLAADRTLADRMGKAARQCVLDRFSWPSVVSACLDAYAA